MTDDTIEIKTTVKRNRRIKIGYNVIPGSDGPKKKVAAIRFSGEYLENLGFEIGKYLQMTINRDKSITLRPIKDEPQEDTDA